MKKNDGSSQNLPHSASDPISLDIAHLSHAYANKKITPTQMVRMIYERIRAQGQDQVWISMVSEQDALARAAGLEKSPPTPQNIDKNRLWGIPFAVKDNIDVSGMPTTAACPVFASDGEGSAPIIDAVLQQGAIFIGKNNLDQFATGLAGVRSPHGVPRNPFNPDYIPGGSSSGSAVAVSSGLVSFALVTDTSGSGRVPAGFNNIVGLKPTPGLVSTRGIIPASRSLDCAAVLALTVEDAVLVREIIAGFDQADPWSRPISGEFDKAFDFSEGFRFAVPRADQMVWFEGADKNPYGGGDGQKIFDQVRTRLKKLGGREVEFDFRPFGVGSEMFSQSALRAERAASIGDFVAAHPDSVLPVIHQVLKGASDYSAIDLWRAHYRLLALRRQADSVWRGADVMVLPSSGAYYRLDAVAAEPIDRPAKLAHYGAFANLFGLAALTVPGGFTEHGLPFGVTLFAPGQHDRRLDWVGSRLQRAAKMRLGASQVFYGGDDAAVGPGVENETIRLAVCGLSLTGEKLNPRLVELGGKLRQTTTTAPRYRLFVLVGKPSRAALLRQSEGEGGGFAIETEIWELPLSRFGRFAASLEAPLSLGRVELADGTYVTGVLCEAWATQGAVDISGYGGWRAYKAYISGAERGG
ncbi:MAG: allophanate hydrolase [Candidatus Symbiobacter sp.]|nr:allophanate hydrolase [Candidatus Symbiobacter sp.]